MLLCLLVAWWLAAAGAQESDDTITIGLLTNAGGSMTNIQPLGVLISGAMRYAVEKVNREKLLGDRTLRFVYNDTKGETLASIRAMTEQWKEHNATAFFGIEDSCYVEAYIASAWDLTAISCKCADAKVSDKAAFPAFARTHPPETKVTKSVIALLQTYQWKSVMIVHETWQRYERLAEKLHETALTNHISSKTYKFESSNKCCVEKKPCCDVNVFAKAIEDTYQSTRIYIFLGSTNNLVKIMSALYKKGLLQYGEYIVIYVELEEFRREEMFRYVWDTSLPTTDMTEDENKLKAAASLLIVGSSLPTFQQYAEFEEKVSQYNAEEPFNFPEPFSGTKIPVKKRKSLYAAYLYDSVMLYVRSLNESLSSPVSGKDAIKRILNVTYTSITGAWNKIDENGDAEGNYSLYAMTNAANYLFNERTYDKFVDFVGTFQDTDQDLPMFKLVNPILWVAGEPPEAEPPCGFDGSKCIQPSDSTRETVSAVLTCLLLAVMVAAMVLYRNWKYEQEIAGLLWKLAFKEIQPRCNGIPWSESKMSVASQTSFEARIWHQVFTRVGTYKGTVVSIKELKFSKRMVDIPRETKKEMKIMREIRQDNINPFVGACVEANRVYIINEYCSKGSLADILDNDNIKLDNMLVASLVWGLIKGMIFLHDSDLKVHGNLKSSNCVVTSRWVLQVADFGLCELLSQAEQEVKEEYQYHWGQLWMAPELVRASRAPRTQKGDVYAFAIIMYEIMGRQGPYSNAQRGELSPKEILSRVRHPGEFYYRPDTGILVCQAYIISCICDCWNERPEQRPEFRHVRNRLKDMRKGMKPNIFDHMLDIMENYANDLEKLVDERTCLLNEEKKKTEALLHRMLPPVVANQLMKGETVEPEYFDKVTIYFSDIVGFTEMSAQSTPLEVVTFLSDLYTLFDKIIGDYEVYKVETIGDAYMVVSGLPVRNGDDHAAQIASMSIRLLEEVRKFKIRHRPDRTLRLRIGIHTGPVVAGVVGITMPRYCLFGDTVNTASRMESTGEALKIHISSHCKDILDNLGGYVIAERGTMKIKGKGDMQTFWLLNMTEDAIRRQNACARTANRLSELEAKRRSPKMSCANLQTRRYSSIPRVADSAAAAAAEALGSPPVGPPSFLVAHKHQKQQQQQSPKGDNRRRKSPRLGRSYSSDGEAKVRAAEEDETKDPSLPNGRASAVKGDGANGACVDEEEVSLPLLRDQHEGDVVKRWRSCDEISPVREKSLFRNLISGLFGSRDGNGEGQDLAHKARTSSSSSSPPSSSSECRAADSESMV